MDWGALIAAVLAIVAMILRYRLNQEKTKGEKVAADADVVADRAAELAKKIQDGKVYDVVSEMDDLARRCRMLRLHTSKTDRNPT